MKNTIINKIKNSIDSSKYKDAFTVFDFQDIGNYETVRKSISRLAQSGYIKRICRGIFYKPTYSTKLNMWSLPNIDNVAFAIARQRGWQICISGVRTLNNVHLSTQISNIYEYAWTGPSTTIKINGVKLVFKKTKQKDFSYNSLTNLVIQSLKEMGQDKIDSKTIKIYKSVLSDKQKKLIQADPVQPTAWIKKALISICSK